ncbi:MAG: hypothetical protein GEU88_13445 [Solirubrobacterales bacterium]|nr:hypothetical protein [Solirubrobacterales bacterium]
MSALLAERRRRLDEGERPLGWKLGFGSPDAMRGLGIAAPLIGYLVRGAVLEPGASVALGDFTRPMLEPEVAVRIAEDLPAGGDAAAARRAIGAVAPALELADVHPPPADVERILAGNVFQRHVMLGLWSREPALAGLVARVRRAGEPEREVDDPWAATGPPVALVRHVADLLGEFGHTLRAGEALICGSVMPPIAVAAGDEVHHALDRHGAVAVRFGA